MPLPIDVNFYFNSTDKVCKNILTNGQLKLCNPFINNLAGDFLGGFHQCLRYMEALIAIRAAMMVLQKPSSLLIEHDGFIHFDERPLDHRLRQSVPLQYLIIAPHQHFELCERCLPKVLV